MSADAAPERAAGMIAAEGARAPGAGAAQGPSWSLFLRLAWIATAAVLVSLIFGGLAMYSAASIQNDQMLEARLEQFGATIRAIVDEHEIELRQRQLAGQPPLETRPTATLLYRYQVWTRGGQLLMRSHEAPADRPMVALEQLGYSASKIDQDEHRVFALPSQNGTFVIQVAENLSEAWSQVGRVTAYYAAFLLVPFGLLLGVVGWVLRRTLRSIRALANDLERRNPLDLAPIPAVQPPREMLPILRAIDTLFARMRRALSIERSFTSLAAHEMRTPLAGLRAQAQFLGRTALPEGEPRETVAMLIRGVDRATYLLDQLLDLARIENLALAGESPRERVHIAKLHDGVVADLAPRIQKQNTRLSARFGVETASCHGFALSVLLRNLLSNAIAYSPTGGLVEVQYLRQRGEFVVIVDDSGKGIPAHQREHAFERFNRLGRTGADGVGLGLAIVLSVVDMHGARIELLESPLGGLRVRVSCPQPDG
jgi:two-component system OmpR family sensor kinase/two-component system sensor histidine kinase QseC